MIQSTVLPVQLESIVCPICKANSYLFDVVDFNKSCLEKKLPLSGMPVYYALCSSCDFCHAPELYSWNIEQFKEKIYNDDYLQLDPDYADLRPRGNAASLISTFGTHKRTIRHLDYGGGEGQLSTLLQATGFDSTSYDPFINTATDIDTLGTFNLITSYEVFEHVSDISALMVNLSSLLAPNGIIIFSTLVSDGHIMKNQRLSWWYASPRNGHISLFSKRSLVKLSHDYGFNFASFNHNVHIFYTNLPAWAMHLIQEY